MPAIASVTTFVGSSNSPSGSISRQENILVLQGQITSASGEFQQLKAQQEGYITSAVNRGHICNGCHQSGHTKTYLIIGNKLFMKLMRISKIRIKIYVNVNFRAVN